MFTLLTLDYHMTDRTNAERQRRYIARLKAQAAKTGVTNVSDHAAPAKELAQAKTRIAEVEKALASAQQRLRQEQGSKPDTDSKVALTEARKEIAALREQLKIKRSAEANITPDMLSLTAQRKLELAIKQEMKRLRAEYQAHLAKCRAEATAEAMEWVVNVLGPKRQAELDLAQRIIKRRDGMISKKTYNKIIACLHPDWVTDTTQKARYEEAFRLFKPLEKLILSERESPTEFESPLPKGTAGWDEARRKWEAEKRAKRKGGSGGIQPK